MMESVNKKNPDVVLLILKYMVAMTVVVALYSALDT
jgi:hypothetical protein